VLALPLSVLGVPFRIGAFFGTPFARTRLNPRAIFGVGISAMLRPLFFPSRPAAQIYASLMLRWRKSSTTYDSLPLCVAA
jgi:hypothetical protein